MFSVGDQVVHPMHGAGIIDGIVQEKVNGGVQEYYVFKMLLGSLQLKIPITGSRTIGLRNIVEPEEAERVLQAIPELSTESNANWNKRYRENLLRLKSGNLYEVARVIKSLTFRERERGLSTGERKMLHTAKQILISEIVLSEKSDYASVEQRLSCAMKSRQSPCKL